MNNINKGIKFAFLTALISGVANFLNKEIISAGIDPILLTALKNIIPGVIFLILAWPLMPQVKNFKKNDWLKFLFIGLIGGSIPFILFFKGLALTSAITGSFIHKTMFLWIAILAWITLNEKFNRWQIFGLTVIIAGLIVMIKITPTFGKGEIMIFGATLLWALETIFVKKFIKNIDFRFLGVARMALGSIFILGFAGFTGKFSLISKLHFNNWFAISLIGLILTGYVYYWYRSLALIPAIATSSILTLAFPITLLLSDLRHFKMLSNPEIIGTLLIGISIYFIVKHSACPNLCQATKN